jgi:hypothetical protein
MVCTTANTVLAIGAAAVLFAALAAGCNDGVLFVPHTNPHFHVPRLQSALEIMLQTVETERLLESVDSAVNPTFNSNGGIKSNQNDWDCVQATNAGLFYWPDGDVNTEDPFYYNHDRAAMLAHAAGGVNGCGSQHLVIHPDFRNVPYTTKSLFEVPEYVREGIRLWVGATLTFGFSAVLPYPPSHSTRFASVDLARDRRSRSPFVGGREAPLFGPRFVTFPTRFDAKSERAIRAPAPRTRPHTRALGMLVNKIETCLWWWPIA